jgi:4,5-dihydroxyphthalate decarboxylase
MHTVVVRADVLEKHPWVARSLYKAFVVAKDLAWRELEEESAPSTMLPFQREHLTQAIGLMGPDPWQYGLEPNEPVLSRFLELAASQGLIPESITCQSLFAPSTLGEHRV